MMVASQCRPLCQDEHSAVSTRCSLHCSSRERHHANAVPGFRSSCLTGEVPSPAGEHVPGEIMRTDAVVLSRLFIPLRASDSWLLLCPSWSTTGGPTSREPLSSHGFSCTDGRSIGSSSRKKSFYREFLRQYFLRAMSRRWSLPLIAGHPSSEDWEWWLQGWSGIRLRR